MIKFIVIALIIIIIVSYSIILGLMKASGKEPPSMPNIQEDNSEDIKLIN